MRLLTHAWLLGAAVTESLFGSHRTFDMPVVFIESGQAGSDRARFLAKGSGLTASFIPEAAVFRTAQASFRMTFPGAKRRPSLVGEGQQPGKVNLFVGDAANWATDLSTWSAIVYRDLYRGVDLRSGSTGLELKSEFVVHPGGDPSSIRVRYEGVRRPRVFPDGSLVLALGGEEVREKAPEAYQHISGERRRIEAGFEVLDNGDVAFRIGAFDSAHPLIIDPVLSYSTLLGGRGLDTIFAVAADASGNAYVAGKTDSYDLPVINGAQSGSRGGVEAFVAKLNSTGKGLVYCTYIGGTGDDRAFGLAIDTAGAAYVTGATYSRDFPVQNAVQPRNGGARNAFILKLNPTGSALLFSTYFGGNSYESGNAIALDDSGYIYVVGDSTSGNFPATGYQKSNRGGQDGFVVKLSPDGKSLRYSTLLGGGSEDHVTAIAVGSAGQATVAGSTYSTDFPVTAGLRYAAGRQDAFVSRLNDTGTALVYSTLIGGSGGGIGAPEEARSLALDGTGKAYVAGVTASADFPVIGGFQAALRGATDGFVAAITPAGILAYSTYLGGSGLDAANAIRLDGSGNMFVAGETISADFTMVGATQSVNAGDFDAFLTRISPAGDTLTYASYLGGNASDTALGLALDPAGNVYVAGQTQSTNWNALNAFQSSNAGNFGGFVAKFTFTSTPVPISVSPAAGSGIAQVFRMQFSDESASTATASILFQTSATTLGGCAVVYNRALNTLTVLADSGATQSTTITPGGSGSAANSQCSVAGPGSAAVFSGGALTLDVALTFQPSFAGSKNVYLQAGNSFGSSGWQMLGTWTVGAVNQAPAAVSVSPSIGSGSAQTFTATFSDGDGVADLNLAMVLIGPYVSGPGSCFVYFDRPSNQIFLANDAGVLGSPATPGSTALLQNSQCSLNLSGSSAAQSGTNLTLTLAIAFKPAYAGAVNIYQYATDRSGATSGWQQRGTWTVTTGAVPPVPVSVSPASGAGSTQTFTLAYSDPAGYSNITVARVLVGPYVSGPNTCYAYLDRVSGRLALATDAGVMGSFTALGSSTILQNSQCAVNLAGSSATGAGTTLTLALSISFQAAFVGPKNVYMMATNAAGLSSEWMQRGTWSVTAPSNQAPSAVSVSPSSGSGPAQTFSFIYSDPDGAVNLASARALIGPYLSGPNSCYIYFDRASSQLFLATDAGVWGSPGVTGAAVTLQNSQCSVSAANSSAATSGNTLTLTVSITFKPAYAGNSSVWLMATDASGADSSWQKLGAWTATVASGTATSSAVSPASGSGTTQTFIFTYTDPGGYASISSVRALFGAYLSGPGTCYLYLDRASNLMALATDGGVLASPAALGSSTTLENSQCSVSLAGASKSESGNNLVLTVPVTFKTGFAGAKSLWMYATGTGTPEWQQRGSWTVPSSGNQAPLPVSVSPSSGSGVSQLFSLVFSDGEGYQNIASVRTLIGPYLSGPNSCYIYFDRAATTVSLASDGGVLGAGAALGSSTMLQNSQCALNVSASSVGTAGNNLTLNLSISFKSAYAGSARVYMMATDYPGADSGWSQLGTWTIP